MNPINMHEIISNNNDIKFIENKEKDEITENDVEFIFEEREVVPHYEGNKLVSLLKKILLFDLPRVQPEQISSKKGITPRDLKSYVQPLHLIVLKKPLELRQYKIDEIKKIFNELKEYCAKPENQESLNAIFSEYLLIEAHYHVKPLTDFDLYLQDIINPKPLREEEQKKVKILVIPILNLISKIDPDQIQCNGSIDHSMKHLQRFLVLFHNYLYKERICQYTDNPIRALREIYSNIKQALNKKIKFYFHQFNDKKYDCNRSLEEKVQDLGDFKKYLENIASSKKRIVISEEVRPQKKQNMHSNIPKPSPSILVLEETENEKIICDKLLDNEFFKNLEKHL